MINTNYKTRKHSTEDKHLCNTCFYEFPTCIAKNIIWSIDYDQSLVGKEADKVIQCDSYLEK